MAAGTGLAPLYGVLREALRQEHQGAIRVIHLAHDASAHYLAEPLQALAASHPQLQVELLVAAELPAALAELRLVSRQTVALLCGPPTASKPLRAACIWRVYRVARFLLTFFCPTRASRSGFQRAGGLP